MFAPVIAALLLLAVGAVAAVWAGDAGLGFLPRLNRTDPALATVPVSARIAGPPLTRRVVLVIADGLSLRSSYGLPFLDELRARGIDARAVSHAPTISRPNYVSIVTGVPPVVSGVRNNFYNAPVALDSIMARVRGARGGVAYVSDSSPGFARMFSHALDDAVYAPWPDGMVKAAVLALQRDYALVIVLPGAVDDAGHLHGADSDEYLEAMQRVDRELAESLAALDLERDTVIIVADHGHTDGGGHGGIEPEVVEVPLILAGAGVRPGAAVAGAQLIDIAPTIAALLGVPAPEHTLGRALTEALQLDDAEATRLDTAARARATRNYTIVEAERALGRVRANANRAERISLAVSALAVGLILLVLGKRRGALHLDWRVIALALPAFPLSFYGLLDIAGGHYSLSALPDEGVGTQRVFYFGLAATGVHVVAAWMVLQGRVVLRDRLAAANALTLCGLMTAAVPALAAWAFYGGGPYVELPPPKMLFLIPALYIAISTYAIAAAVIIGLELVIFFARVFDPRLPLRRAEARVERERERLTSLPGPGGPWERRARR